MNIQRDSLPKEMSRPFWATFKLPVANEYDSAHRLPPMVEELVEILRYRDLLAQFVSRNIKVRYKRSVLGVAWTMLNPLLMMTILTLVFSNVFRISVERYPIFVLSGLVLWNFFAATTIISINDLVWGGDLFHRIYMPRTIFAASSTGSGLLNLVLALVPLMIIMLGTGVVPSLAMLFLPVAILFMAMFTLGVSLFISALAVYFADILDIHQIVLSAWMYLTPIIYPIEIVPSEYRWLFNLNPMYHLLACFRSPVYAGVLPSGDHVLVAAISAIVVLFGGWWFFANRADEFAYRV